MSRAKVWSTLSYCTELRLYPQRHPHRPVRPALILVIMSRSQPITPFPKLFRTLVQGALPAASPSITKLWWHCRKLMSCMTDHIVLFKSSPAFSPGPWIASHMHRLPSVTPVQDPASLPPPYSLGRDPKRKEEEGKKRKEKRKEKRN